MRQYPATDLQQRSDEILDAARREPVSITEDGRPRYVLMSREAYEERLAGAPVHHIDVEETSDEHLTLLEGEPAATRT